MKKATVVKLKRVYEGIGKSDGTRYLVERLWPLGIEMETQLGVGAILRFGSNIKGLTTAASM